MPDTPSRSRSWIGQAADRELDAYLAAAEPPGPHLRAWQDEAHDGEHAAAPPALIFQELRDRLLLVDDIPEFGPEPRTVETPVTDA